MSVLLRMTFLVMLQLWYDDNVMFYTLYINTHTVSLQVFVGQNLRYDVGSPSSAEPRGGGTGVSTVLAAVVGVCVPLLLIALAIIIIVGIILFIKFRIKKTGLVSVSCHVWQSTIQCIFLYLGLYSKVILEEIEIPNGETPEAGI